MCQNIRLSTAVLASLAMAIALDIAPLTASRALAQSLPQPEENASRFDSLSPEPNLLFLPTQPEAVEITTTETLSIEEAFELASRNNEDLQIALLELERSQFALREARAELYPTVGLASTLLSNSEEDNNRTTLRGDLEALYDLGLSGGRQARIQVAEEQVRIAELDINRRRSQLLLDTANDYYALQLTVEQIRISQAFLDEAERNLQDTTLSERVGVGTQFDVLRAEVQVANARQDLTQVQSQRQIAQRQLSRRLNLPASVNVDTLPVEIAGGWPLSLEESIVLAYQSRVELSQVLAQRTIAQRQRQIALAAVRPSLSLVANYGLQQALSGNSTTLDDGFSVGARLQWQLFDGGAASASAAQQDKESEIAETQFSQTRNSVRLEVEEAYFNLTANQENITTANAAIEQAQEALRLANLRFDAGVGTQLDVLSAIGDLAEAEGNLANAVIDYNRSLAAIQRATEQFTAQTN